MTPETAGRAVLWLLGLGAAVASITPLCFSVPYPEHNPFTSHHGGDFVWGPYTSCLKMSDAWWLLLNAGAALLLASLAAAAQALAGARATRAVTAARAPTAAAPPPPPPAAAGAAGAAARLMIRRGYTWGHLALLCVWALWNAASLAAPLAYASVDEPYWLESAPDGAPKPARAALWVYAIGAKAAWPCLGNFFLCMLTAARTTPLLVLMGAKAEGVIWFHKLTSRAAIFWLAIHGLFCQIPVFIVSADLWWWQFWVPTNPVGWWNWAGNMALVACVVILVTSLALVRRRAYNTFRAAHYALWAVILFSVWHYSVSLWYFMLGVILYGADLAHRWVYNARATTARLEVPASSVPSKHRERFVLMHVEWPAGEPCPPGATVYVNLPRVSRLEWHPFSVAASRPGGFTLIIKAVGGWTEACHRLAEAAGGGADVQVSIEAPYPCAAHRALAAALASGGAAAIVTGGSAVSAALPLLESAASAGAAGRTGLVWTTRSGELLAEVEPALARAANLGASIEVFYTGHGELPTLAATSTAGAGAGAAAAASWDGRKDAAAAPADAGGARAAAAGVCSKDAADDASLGGRGADLEAALDQSTTASDFKEGFSSPAAAATAAATAAGAAGRARGAPAPHIAALLLVTAAAAGCVLGYVTAASLACSFTLPDTDPLWPKMEAVYNKSARAAAPALRANGTAAAGGGWPEGQAQFGDRAPYVCWAAGREPRVYDYCQVPYVDERLWPAGARPAGRCLPTGDCFAVPGLLQVLLSSAGALLMPLLAALALRAWAEWRAGPSTISGGTWGGSAFSGFAGAPNADLAPAACGGVRVTCGRPDLHAALSELLADLQLRAGGVAQRGRGPQRLGVFVCGPRELSRGARAAAAALAGAGAASVQVHNINWA
ncbi:MAG: hypothetical protein J3K34DRAFT_509459 [Monoraphidium minutum]|nr:MAG: hypothetical protein J3K34DRAFT_509459 [Monoraphidium minutum]